MKKIICLRKGSKLAQEKDCKCDIFKVFKDKNDKPIIECVKCDTRYDLEKI